jgi:hypothetical protein
VTSMPKCHGWRAGASGRCAAVSTRCSTSARHFPESRTNWQDRNFRILPAGARGGFSFVARQKRVQLDGEDFYIDLLFFSRKLKRLVAVELKQGAFRPEYKGQMELYLRWLAKYEREKDEFLCRLASFCARERVHGRLSC